MRICSSLFVRLVRVRNVEIGFSFSGLCRGILKDSMENNAHDWYLVSEDDMNFTSARVSKLCEEFRFLGRNIYELEQDV